MYFNKERYECMLPLTSSYARPLKRDQVCNTASLQSENVIVFLFHGDLIIQLPYKGKDLT